MAWTDLDPTEQEQVKQFIREYRAGVGDTVRGLRTQNLLALQFTNTIGDLWSQISNGDVIPDGTGLAGADITMTKGDFNTLLQWTQDVLAGLYSDDGGAVATVWPDQETVDAYGVQAAGPGNI